MTGKKLMLEKDIEDKGFNLEEVELETTSFWYGPHSPLTSPKEKQECTPYRHIFFPTKL